MTAPLQLTHAEAAGLDFYDMMGQVVHRRLLERVRQAFDGDQAETLDDVRAHLAPAMAYQLENAWKELAHARMWRQIGAIHGRLAADVDRLVESTPAKRPRRAAAKPAVGAAGLLLGRGVPQGAGLLPWRQAITRTCTTAR